MGKLLKNNIFCLTMIKGRIVNFGVLAGYQGKSEF